MIGDSSTSDKLDLLAKKLKLRWHLFWNKVCLDDPDENPLLLSLRPRQGPLISLRNEEYVDYLFEHKRRSAFDLPRENICLDTLKLPGQLDSADRDTMTEIYNLLQYAEEGGDFDADGEDKENEEVFEESGVQAESTLRTARLNIVDRLEKLQQERVKEARRHHLRNLEWLSRFKRGLPRPASLQTASSPQSVRLFSNEPIATATTPTTGTPQTDGLCKTVLNDVSLNAALLASGEKAIRQARTLTPDSTTCMQPM